MSVCDSLFSRAQRVIPGGVNSPVRAFNGVGGTPLYVESGKGARIRSAEGRELTDFCCSWGAMILGHARAEVVAAIAEQAAKGTTFGINTPIELALAERLTALVPGLEQVRLVNSGTEAVMTALRLARGCTGRRAIVKFEGCYHGHGDAMLVSAGSGLLTGGETSSAGVPPAVAADTFVVPYNDVAAVEKLFAAKGAEIAGVIVEPVAANMGLVLPRSGFLAKLRELTARAGALLIFDEVINGFRFHFSTYGKLVGIVPDLTTMGKVIGGGLPLAAVGGRRLYMSQLAPTGRVYQAGTLSGNPLAVVAGLKTLELLEREDPYGRMAELGGRLATTFNSAAESRGIPARISNFKGVFTLFCSRRAMTNAADTRSCDTALYARLFHGALDAGFYLPPSQFEVGFISAAHTASDVDGLVSALVTGGARLNG